MSNKPTVAIFPVAGLGLRFLPITKSGPKEMLPIIDRPLIQYAVEEAISVGVTELIFVTSAEKVAIENYFDKNHILEKRLKERGKYNELSQLNSILPSNVSISFIRQPEPLGLGDAILRTKDAVGDRPFVVLLPDDIMESGSHTCLGSMMAMYESHQSSVLAVERVPLQDVHKYGIITFDPASSKVTSIIEKPSVDQAPSDLAVTGRYILTPRIFDLLEKTEKGHGNELQLTDAIAKLITEENVYSCALQGKRFDCGNPFGFLQATISFAIKRPELSHFKHYLKNFIGDVVDNKIENSVAIQ